MIVGMFVAVDVPVAKTIKVVVDVGIPVEVGAVFEGVAVARFVVEVAVGTGVWVLVGACVWVLVGGGGVWVNVAVSAGIKATPCPAPFAACPVTPVASCAA